MAWATALVPLPRLFCLAEEASGAVPAGTKDQGGQQGQADDRLRNGLGDAVSTGIYIILPYKIYHI